MSITLNLYRMLYLNKVIDAKLLDFSLLNLYRMLYLNVNPSWSSFAVSKIEPIQNVVFKWRQEPLYLE